MAKREWTVGSVLPPFRIDDEQEAWGATINKPNWEAFIIVWSSDRAEAESHARLIVAAPDLYEALNWLTHTCCDVGKSGDPPTQAEHDAAIKVGQEALAKAEGK